MSLNIITAVKNISSDKYNKKNLYTYLILFVIFMAISFSPYAFMPVGTKTNIPPNLIVPVLLITISTFLFAIWIAGIQITAIYNLGHRKKGAFLHATNDFKTIFPVGIKLFGGIILWEIILVICGLILSIPIALGGAAASITLLILLSIATLFFVPLMYVSYCNTLQFSNLFNFSKAIDLIKKSKGRIFLYFLLCFVVMLLAIGIYLAIGCVISFFFMGVKSLNPVPLYITFGILSGTIGFLAQLIIIDLTGQILREINPVKQKTQTTQV